MYGKGVGPESTALEQKYFDDIQKLKYEEKNIKNISMLIK